MSALQLKFFTSSKTKQSVCYPEDPLYPILSPALFSYFFHFTKLALLHVRLLSFMETGIPLINGLTSVKRHHRFLVLLTPKILKNCPEHISGLQKSFPQLWALLSACIVLDGEPVLLDCIRHKGETCGGTMWGPLFWTYLSYLIYQLPNKSTHLGRG